jgi:hypothetical protein
LQTRTGFAKSGGADLYFIEPRLFGDGYFG